MKKLFAALAAATLVASCCCTVQAQVPPELGAVFAISYVDELDRQVDGTITVTAGYAALDIMLIGDEGSIPFMNEFPRLAEAGESPEVEVVQFQDFTGLIGGSVDLVGFGLLGAEIVRGTIPRIEAGEVIIWNQGTGMVSAGNTGPAETQLVNVPEPAASVTFVSGLASLLVGFGLMFRRMS